jgi:hypothetical protein
MTQSGIEPATSRLITQYLNQLRYRVPPEMLVLALKIGQRIPFQNLMVTDVVFHNFF